MADTEHTTQSTRSEPSPHPETQHPGGTTDSAGVPWEGRTFTPTGFEGDDGSIDADVERCLRTLGNCEPGRDRSLAVRALTEALLAHRVLVPIVAEETEEGAAVLSPTGIDIRPDRSADVAMVSLIGPDGRPSLPVFTHMAAMASWNAQARPIPVDTRKAFLSAVSEGCQTVWVDPGSPEQVLIPRPAVWAYAQGTSWKPFLADDAARAQVRDAVLRVPEIGGVHFAGSKTAEVHVVCGLTETLAPAQLRAVSEAVSAAVAACDVAPQIDSLQLSFAAMQ